MKVYENLSIFDIIAVLISSVLRFAVRCVLITVVLKYIAPICVYNIIEGISTSTSIIAFFATTAVSVLLIYVIVQILNDIFIDLNKIRYLISGNLIKEYDKDSGKTSYMTIDYYTDCILPHLQKQEEQ